MSTFSSSCVSGDVLLSMPVTEEAISKYYRVASFNCQFILSERDKAILYCVLVFQGFPEIVEVFLCEDVDLV